VQEINELSFRRLQGPVRRSPAYYRPFLFCFDQTEFLRRATKALVDALGRCISDFHSSLANNLTIVTTNANNWSQEILPDLQRALSEPVLRRQDHAGGVSRRISRNS